MLFFFDVCVKEVFRFYFVFGLLMEWIVFELGFEIVGYWVRGGIIVGCNVWVLYRDKKVWGEDVEEFRLERWVDEMDGERLKGMNGCML